MEICWWEKQAEEMGQLNKANRSHEFFERVRRIAKEMPNRGIKKRPLPSEEQLSLPKMTQHFEELLNLTREYDSNLIDGIPEIRTTIDWSAPTLAEVQSAITRMKNNKAPGPSGVPVECLKGSLPVAQTIHRELKLMWENGDPKLPDEWKEATLIALYKKKGKYEDLNNWRGIVLMEVLSKIINATICDKLQKAGEEICGEEQHGFRRGRGTVECAFIP